MKIEEWGETIIFDHCSNKVMNGGGQFMRTNEIKYVIQILNICCLIFEYKPNICGISTKYLPNNNQIHPKYAPNMNS